MRGFWDRRARENAFYYVDNRLDYRSPDIERFWADGEATVDDLLDRVGVAVEPSDTVVEIGCGVGRLTRTLAARAARVLAFDVSEHMLELAREHNPHLHNVEWMLGEGSTLAGVDDEVANACFSHVVFQHIPEPQITLAYVSEMGRVLRPGGWAAFQLSNDPAAHRWRLSARHRLLAAIGREPREQDDPAWLGSAVALDDLHAAARAGGMAVEQVIGAGTQFCLLLARKPGPEERSA